jgi:ABC-type uncharacterized transport system involved in gliding motility auxiliary subunit
VTNDSGGQGRIRRALNALQGNESFLLWRSRYRPGGNAEKFREELTKERPTPQILHYLGGSREQDGRMVRGILRWLPWILGYLVFLVSVLLLLGALSHWNLTIR